MSKVRLTILTFRTSRAGYLGKMGFPFRCRELRKSDSALARAAGAAPRPDWAGMTVDRAQVAALAGSGLPGHDRSGP